jgi:hypothetical protein
MLKTEGDTFESYLGKIEASVREMRPEWDKEKQWKVEVSDKKAIPKIDMIDYDKKLILIGKATFNIAFNGNEDTEKAILTTCSVIAAGLETTGK